MEILYFILGLLTASFIFGIVLFIKNKITYDPNEISYREILEQIPACLYWKGRDNFLLGCNKKILQVVGLKSEKDYIGKTDYEFSLKEEADKIRLNDEEVLRKNKAKVFEETYTVNGKRSLYHSYKGPLKNKKNQVIGILGVSVDITKDKQKEMERLRTLDSIIAVMPGNVYWVDKNNVYLGCNDNQAKAIGLSSRKDIIGKSNVDIGGFLIPDVLDKTNKEVMCTGKKVVVEEPAVLLDGTRATFLSSKVPLYDSSNEINGMVGISINITERKQIEAELKKEKERAEHLNNAKTEFLYNMRHDFRTPLSGILGMSNLLYNEERNSCKKEQLKCVIKGSEELLKQLDEIMEFLRIQDGVYTLFDAQFDLYQVLSDISNLILPAVEEKNLRFQLDKHENLPKYVIGDRTRTQRILMNLLSNAVKFTNHGSVNMEISLVRKENNNIVIKFKIKDTGIGIPKEEMNVIFEKLTRLTPSYKGLYKGKGLGLRIVKQFLNELSGEVYVESKINEGTTFVVLIPYKLPLLGLSKEKIFDDVVSAENLEKNCII